VLRFQMASQRAQIRDRGFRRDDHPVRKDGTRSVDTRRPSAALHAPHRRSLVNRAPRSAAAAAADRRAIRIDRRAARADGA
jgi:hypothetical protein